MADNRYIEIGERLQSEAIRKYKTVVELERLLGKGKGYLSQYVGGRNKPGKWLQNELRLLDLDIEFIMQGKRNPAYIIEYKIRNQIISRLQDWAIEKYKDGWMKLPAKLGVEFDRMYSIIDYPESMQLGILLKLSELGCDINWLLNGTTINGETMGKVRESQEEYNSNLNQRLINVEETLIKLKEENNDLKKLLTVLLSENISLDSRSRILLALNIQMDALKKDVNGNSP